MLPEDSLLKQLYRKLIKTNDPTEAEKLEALLRSQIKPGNIDVNIMTKVDRENFNEDGSTKQDGSDAVAALRGFAKSKLKNSSVVFSAGLNPRPVSYTHLTLPTSDLV